MPVKVTGDTGGYRVPGDGGDGDSVPGDASYSDSVCLACIRVCNSTTSSQNNNKAISSWFKSFL